MEYLWQRNAAPWDIYCSIECQNKNPLKTQFTYKIHHFILQLRNAWLHP